MFEVKDICCSGDVKTLILACSGKSNVGQAANNAMIQLDKNGIGDAYCLAGIGAGLSGFIEIVKAAKTVLIDGCPVGCGKKTFEKYGIKPTHYFVVTEMGIKKKDTFNNLEAETAPAMDYISCNI